jgi:hypothetical protein
MVNSARRLWETYWEKSSIEDSGIYGVDPTWDFFVDVVKE